MVTPHDAAISAIEFYAHTKRASSQATRNFPRCPLSPEESPPRVLPRPLRRHLWGCSFVGAPNRPAGSLGKQTFKSSAIALKAASNESPGGGALPSSGQPKTPIGRERHRLPHPRSVSRIAATIRGVFRRGLVAESDAGNFRSPSSDMRAAAALDCSSERRTVSKATQRTSQPAKRSRADGRCCGVGQ
jgi:hypothetical protein